MAIVLTIINIIIVALEYPGSASGTTALVLNILFCFAQFYIANILYRYWEFVKYNYDENFEVTLRELADSRFSQQSAGVLSGKSHTVSRVLATVILILFVYMCVLCIFNFPGLHSPQSPFSKSESSVTSLRDVVGNNGSIGAGRPSVGVGRMSAMSVESANVV